MPTIKYKPVGPTPRKSKAKPKKTHTCPVCAERFTASRSDQRFCSVTCRVRNHKDDVPAEVQAKADAMRADRTEKAARSKAKREAAKATREANRVILEQARELYLQAYEDDWNHQIQCEIDPAQREFLSQIRDEGLASIREAPSVPERYREMVRKQNQPAPVVKPAPERETRPLIATKGFPRKRQS